VILGLWKVSHTAIRKKLYFIVITVTTVILPISIGFLHDGPYG
jgi:hypothetical protein